MIPVVAAACSGKGAASAPPVDATNAPVAGLVLADGAESSAGGFSAQTSGAVCQSGTDNEIQTSPTSATITFDNCSATGAGGTETINGTIKISESTTSGLKFTASHDLTVVIVGAGTNAGITENAQLTGDRSADFPASGTKYTMSDATDDADTIVDQGTTYALSDSKSWSDAYTPDTTWTPGTALVAGEIAISGGWNFHVNAQAAGASLSSSGSGLRIDPACPRHVVAGTLTASWTGTGGQSATMTVTWTACGVRTVSYTGP